jgi:hypothetical protein
MQRSTTEHE